METLKSIERLLSKAKDMDLTTFKKAYDKILKLRSQLLSIICDIEEYIETKEGRLHTSPILCQAIMGRKQMIKLVIDEPLPARKELTATLEEYWITLIHKAIAEKNMNEMPKFDKAMVVIEIIAPKGTNNKKVWDTSNRAINVIINNLKGIFFRDDNFEHMACAVLADWGDTTGKTIIKIYDFEDYFEENFDEKFEIL